MNFKFVPVDHDRMELVADYLRRPALIEKFYSEPDISWSGSPGSIAQSERAYCGPGGTGTDWTRAVATAYSAARLLVIGMAEQMLAVARIITDPELGAHGLGDRGLLPIIGRVRGPCLVVDGARRPGAKPSVSVLR